LYVVVAGTNGGAGFLDEELRLEVRLHLLVEVRVAPREELAMIVGYEEAWLAEVVERLEAHGGGIAEYAHIDVACSTEAHIAHLGASDAELCRGVVMETPAECLDKLTSDVNVVLIGGGIATRAIGQLIMAELMGDEYLGAHRDILIETLEETYGEGVLHNVIGGLVEDRVAWVVLVGHVVAIEVEILVGGVGYVATVVGIEPEGMNETGDGHVFLFGPRGVGGMTLGEQYAVSRSLEERVVEMCLTSLATGGQIAHNHGVVRASLKLLCGGR